MDNESVANRRTAKDRLHSPSRERILRIIETSGSASVNELVDSTGLHENTVRGHLDRLQTDGHIRRERAQSKGRGRPAIRWKMVTHESAATYAGLAITLADTLAKIGPKAATLARDAGKTWGKQLLDERRNGADTDNLVLDIMREQGFAPEMQTEIAEDGGHASDATNIASSIELHSCPLIAAASGRTDIVCAVHEGMVEAIAQTDTQNTRVKLVPFSDGGACVVHLLRANT